VAASSLSALDEDAMGRLAKAACVVADSLVNDILKNIIVINNDLHFNSQSLPSESAFSSNLWAELL